MCVYLFIYIYTLWSHVKPIKPQSSAWVKGRRVWKIIGISQNPVLECAGCIGCGKLPMPCTGPQLIHLDSTHPQMLILNWLYPLAHAYIANWKNHNFYPFLQNQLFLWPFSIANCNKLPVGTTFFPHRTFDRLPHHFAPHLAMFRSDFTFWGCYVPCIVMEGHVVYCI